MNIQAPHLPLTIVDENGWPHIEDAYGEYVARVATKKDAEYLVAAANHFPALLALVERFASECACGGSGRVAEYAPYEEGQRNAEPRFVDCPACADLRQVLAAVREGQT